jgi:LPS-assembly lipoprotein
MFLLAGCAFEPVYGPDGVGQRWQGKIAVDAPNTVFGAGLRTRLIDVFGPVTTTQFDLAVVPQVAAVSATVTEDGDSTRFNLTGNAAWTLTDAAGNQVADGLAQTFTSYSATGSTVATQTAEGDAQARLAVALADLIVQQVLSQGNAP